MSAVMLVHIEYETLVAAVREALPGKAHWVDFDEDVKVGLTVFKLRQRQLGDNFGEVRVRKAGDYSELYYSDPQHLPERDWTQEEKESLKGLPFFSDEWEQQVSVLERKVSAEREELHRRRQEHVDKVIQAMLNGLNRDIALQEALPAVTDEQATPQVEGSAVGGEGVLPLSFPKTASGKERARKIWKIVKQVKQGWLTDFEQGYKDDPEPPDKDLVDAVNEEFSDRKYKSARRIKDFEKWGDEGLLE